MLAIVSPIPLKDCCFNQDWLLEHVYSLFLGDATTTSSGNEADFQEMQQLQKSRGGNMWMVFYFKHQQVDKKNISFGWRRSLKDICSVGQLNL